MHPLRFRSGRRFDVVDNSHLFILNEGSRFLVDDRAAAEIALAIDGKRTAQEVVIAAAATVGPTEAFRGMTRLAQAGHLVSAPPIEGGEAEYWESRGESESSRTEERDVALCALTSTRDSAEVQELVSRLANAARLQHWSVTIVEPSEASAVPSSTPLVVLCEDYCDPRLGTIDDGRSHAEAPWLVLKPWGGEAWIGPEFGTDDSVCWHCVNERLVSNRQTERYLANRRNSYPEVRPAGLAPAATALIEASMLVALDHWRTKQTENTALHNAFLTMSHSTLEQRSHIIAPSGGCARCGTPRVETDAVTLEPVSAASTDDGGYRVCEADVTVDRLSPHISPLVGAVSRLESLDMDSSTTGIAHSYAAGHNFAMVNDNLRLLRDNMRGQSGGKGRSRTQAKASAMCEAIERHNGVYDGRPAAIRAPYSEVADRAVHPNSLLHYSPWQYEHRKELNEDPRHRLQRIPDPFDESRPIDFTAARSLTDGSSVLVPSGYCWFGHPDLEEHTYAFADSNGGASGNTLEEAVLQGLCELVERDAVALWWFNRVQRPGIDLDSFNEPYIDRLRDFYASQERNLWVLDLRTDLQMPVFAAFSRRDHEVEDIMVGFGAHPDPKIALMRSLTELNQFLPFVQRRDDKGNTLYRTDDEATLDWCTTATCENEPWVAPSATSISASDFQWPATKRLDHLVSGIVNDLKAHDIDTLVVNQSRPGIELAVAKVIAPGLRHFWRRTGPGRIYDVPVALGWLEKPTAEDNINPRGVFF